MVDTRYPTNVADGVKPLFEQLNEQFGAEFEIWHRVCDFGRYISAGVVNTKTEFAANVLVKKAGQQIRSSLDTTEINKIRHFLTSASSEDLVI